jgi:hypothetical protein
MSRGKVTKRVTANDVLVWLLEEHIGAWCDGLSYAKCAADTRRINAGIADAAEDRSRVQFSRAKALLEAVCAIGGKGPVAAKAHAAALAFMLNNPQVQWCVAARRLAATLAVVEMPPDLLDADHDGPIRHPFSGADGFKRIFRLAPYDKDSAVVILPAPIAA